MGWIIRKKERGISGKRRRAAKIYREYIAALNASTGHARPSRRAVKVGGTE